MKFVALVSGGKDSVYSILECSRHGHELVACVHLAAALPPSNDEEPPEESYMYQSAASEALTTLVEECLGVPLVHHRRVGRSVNTSMVYSQAVEGDEVEDLYQALTMAKQRFPEVQAVSSGAILSTYQRVRIEHVCSRLQLTSLSYLWRAAPQHALLDRMINDGITAVLVRAACPPGLVPRKHLNKTLKELHWDTGLFLQLNQKYQFHMCGEGGEYESLVLDCPLYKKRLVLDDVEIVELEGDEGVGVLRIKKCHAEAKTDTEDSNTSHAAVQDTSTTTTTEKAIQSPDIGSRGGEQLLDLQHPRVSCLPRVRRLEGGLMHVSEIICPIVPNVNDEGLQDESELAVLEAQSVLFQLERVLRRHHCTPQDVMFVHVYLSEISHFAKINAYYQRCFGTLLPPSRSCVAVGRHVLPGGRRVLLDCLVQCGSGKYLRGELNSLRSTCSDHCNPTNETSITQDHYNAWYARTAQLTTTSRLREVLHVQSISHWAPVCVGPYSQVNTLRSALHFLAGQIGLKPATMTLHTTWEQQLRQCWTNVASVLDALDGGSLTRNMMGGVVYVADHIFFQQKRPADTDVYNSPLQVQPMIVTICRQEIVRNGGVAAGLTDSPLAPQSKEDVDSDDGCDKNLQNAANGPICTMLLVSIPEMPVGALVEVEVVAATQKAASCLPIQDVCVSFDRRSCGRQNLSPSNTGWDTGHDFPLDGRDGFGFDNMLFEIKVSLRSLGIGGAAIVNVIASVPTSNSPTDAPMNGLDVDMEQLIGEMFASASKALATPSQSEDGDTLSGFKLGHALHVRLFYVASQILGDGRKVVLSDGTQVRSSLQAAISLRWPSTTAATAATAVPVQAINLLQMSDTVFAPTAALAAMQLLVVDAVQVETDLWVHSDRI